LIRHPLIARVTSQGTGSWEPRHLTVLPPPPLCARCTVYPLLTHQLAEELLASGSVPHTGKPAAIKTVSQHYLNLVQCLTEFNLSAALRALEDLVTASDVGMAVEARQRLAATTQAGQVCTWSQCVLYVCMCVRVCACVCVEGGWVLVVARVFSRVTLPQWTRTSLPCALWHSVYPSCLRPSHPDLLASPCTIPSQTLLERLGVDVIAVQPATPGMASIPRWGSQASVGPIATPTHGPAAGKTSSIHPIHAPVPGTGSRAGVGGPDSSGVVDGGCGVVLELVEAASALAHAADPLWSGNPMCQFIMRGLRGYVASPCVRTACVALGAIPSTTDEANALVAAVALASPDVLPEDLLAKLCTLGPKCVRSGSVAPHEKRCLRPTSVRAYVLGDHTHQSGHVRALWKCLLLACGGLRGQR
jgi:hypothetical protein